MKRTPYYTVLLLIVSYTAAAQGFYFRQGLNAPKFIRTGTINDTLLNPFAGGLNTPQLSNIDLNADGKQDLFIFDKEAGKVSCYIYDNGRFRHAPQYEGAFPGYLTGWALLKDHNFDNKPDLFTASFPYTVTTPKPWVPSNTIQLFVNSSTNGKLRFEQHSNFMLDTGMYLPSMGVDDPGSPITAINGALPGIDDMDGDGDIDILTNQNEISTMYYYENLKRNKWNVPFHDDSVVYIFRDQCWGFIYYNFRHYYSLHASRDSNWSCKFNMWGKRVRKDGEQSMLLLDLNGDGIKDYVMGDGLHKSFISLINGRLQNSIQIDSIVSQDTLFLSENNARKNFIEYPAAYYADINGDNKNELVISTNKLHASKNLNNFWLYDVTRVGSHLQFTPQAGNDLLYRDMIDLGYRTAPAFSDVDADGDEDLIVATSGNYESTFHNNDRLYLYKNITGSATPVFQLADSNFAKLSEISGQGFFSAHPAFGDLNGDGKDDLLLGEGSGNIAYFVNTSSGGNTSFNMVSRTAFNISAGTYATPQLIDLDKDGLLDIVTGNAIGKVKFFKNTGTKTAPEFSSTATVDSLGNIDSREMFYALSREPRIAEWGYSAPHVVDIDNDGSYEMIVGSGTGRVYVYDNIYPHKDSAARIIDKPFVDDNERYNKRFGNSSTIASADLNGDNRPDLLIGNISGGLVFLANTFIPSGLKDHMEIDRDAVTVFPNPTTSTVAIQLNRNSSLPVRYTIFDLAGKEIMSGSSEPRKSQLSIDVSGFNHGLYFIRFESSDWYSAQKLIIGN